jgi:hypothetical protein
VRRARRAAAGVRRAGQEERGTEGSGQGSWAGQVGGLPAEQVRGRRQHRLAAAEALATSADEEVVCEGEKTLEERDAELRGEAVLLARDSTKMVKVGELP